MNVEQRIEAFKQSLIRVEGNKQNTVSVNNDRVSSVNEVDSSSFASDRLNPETAVDDQVNIQVSDEEEEENSRKKILQKFKLTTSTFQSKEEQLFTGSSADKPKRTKRKRSSTQSNTSVDESDKENLQPEKRMKTKEQPVQFSAIGIFNRGKVSSEMKRGPSIATEVLMAKQRRSSGSKTKSDVPSNPSPERKERRITHEQKPLGKPTESVAITPPKSLDSQIFEKGSYFSSIRKNLIRRMNQMESVMNHPNRCKNSRQIATICSRITSSFFSFCKDLDKEEQLMMDMSHLYSKANVTIQVLHDKLSVLQKPQEHSTSNDSDWLFSTDMEFDSGMEQRSSISSKHSGNQSLFSDSSRGLLDSFENTNRLSHSQRDSCSSSNLSAISSYSPASCTSLIEVPRFEYNSRSEPKECNSSEKRMKRYMKLFL